MAITGVSIDSISPDTGVSGIDSITSATGIVVTFTVFTDGFGGSYNLQIFDGSSTSDGGSLFNDGASIAAGTLAFTSQTFTVTLQFLTDQQSGGQEQQWRRPPVPEQ